MRARKILIAGVLAIAVTARVAYGDPTDLHLHTASHVVTTGGTALDLPPGYFMDEATYDKWNLQVKTLQDTNTNLTAQNKSMRASLAQWQPGFYTMITVIVGGIALGWYAHDKL